MSSKAHLGSLTPTEAEKKIYEARIYVFGSTKMLEEIVEADVSADNMKASKLFELNTGNHYFYAAVNIPESKFAGVEKFKTTMEAFKDHILNIPALAEAENGINNVTINVGRAVAKIGVDFIPGDQIGGKLSNVTYRVRNNPNQLYSAPLILGSVWRTPYYSKDVAGTYFDSSSDFKQAGIKDSPCVNTCYATPNSNEIPTQGNASFISIKGTFTPSEVYNADGTTTGILDGSGDFWRIAIYDGDPASADSKFVDFGSKYYYEQPDAGQYDASKQKPVKYDNGTCYYGLWIADNSKTEANERYTVKRNTFYWINILSVDGAGANTEAGVIISPDQELDSEAWIYAQIKVEDWSGIEQSVGI